jgi:hypothetical protein
MKLRRNEPCPVSPLLVLLWPGANANADQITAWRSSR